MPLAFCQASEPKSWIVRLGQHDEQLKYPNAEFRSRVHHCRITHETLPTMTSLHMRRAEGILKYIVVLDQQLPRIDYNAGTSDHHDCT
ncbi:hypothetical protein OH77DRAFT_1060891 [Trametes cingulata]|nr:hypothetical protein OH77DRAFT_1060891 [Trametes cingulata]